jgi:hypothetical protein
MKRLLLLYLTTAFCCTAATAQFYNNGTFYVGASGVLFVNSSYTNTTAADYQNDGTVYITGNLVNNQASMPAGAGRTYFSGVSAQTLSGAQPFRNLNINIDNASGVILANRLAVGNGTSGLLTFTTGLITSGTTTQDVYFYPGSGYTGFDSLHGVIGYVTKSGSTNFDFPLSTGAHPADLELTGLSGDADFQVLYTGSGYGQYNTDGSLVAGGVFAGEWWNIARNAGTADAQVTLKWDQARKVLNVSDPAGLVVAHFTGGSWTDAGGTSTNTAGSNTGSVGPSNALSSFSPFTFGSTVNPLPITLGSFAVTNQDCQAYLSWTTTLELNAAGFEVQESTDGVSFTTVATIKADDAASTYHTTVAQQAQQAFYRLMMTDVNGASTYSWIVGLNLTCLPAAQHLALYPNPVTTGAALQARLTSATTRGTAQLEVFDGMGRKVLAQMVYVNSGSNLFEVPVANLAQGIYTVIVIGDSWRSDVMSFSRTGN